KTNDQNIDLAVNEENFDGSDNELIAKQKHSGQKGREDQVILDEENGDDVEQPGSDRTNARESNNTKSTDNTPKSDNFNGVDNKDKKDNADRQNVALTQSYNGVPTVESNTIPQLLTRIDWNYESTYDTPLKELYLRPRLYLGKKNNKQEGKIWLGVAFAYGNNNPGTSGGSFNDATASPSFESRGDAVSLSEEEAGRVVSTGLTVGTQVSQKWILESGVQFIQRNTFMQSNIANVDGASTEAVNSLSLSDESGDFMFTDSYEIRNTYSSIGVPLQAGYILLDEKINVVLKAGINNEILLSNRVEDTSGNFETTTIKAGDAQYNTLLFSGLIGTEFSYLFGENYFLSINPQMSKSINSITNSDSGNESRPLIFSLGFRLKYIFE
ncbi:MAG: hypothetical protein R3345_09245, partial [Fulvivirga sp.]|nr:hypothetical protein [Fulvivirga sp.]